MIFNNFMIPISTPCFDGQSLLGLNERLRRSLIDKDQPSGYASALSKKWNKLMHAINGNAVPAALIGEALAPEIAEMAGIGLGGEITAGVLPSEVGGTLSSAVGDTLELSGFGAEDFELLPIEAPNAEIAIGDPFDEVEAVFDEGGPAEPVTPNNLFANEESIAAIRARARARLADAAADAVTPVEEVESLADLFAKRGIQGTLASQVLTGMMISQWPDEDPAALQEVAELVVDNWGEIKQSGLGLAGWLSAGGAAALTAGKSVLEAGRSTAGKLADWLHPQSADEGLLGISENGSAIAESEVAEIRDAETGELVGPRDREVAFRNILAPLIHQHATRAVTDSGVVNRPSGRMVLSQMGPALHASSVLMAGPRHPYEDAIMQQVLVETLRLFRHVRSLAELLLQERGYKLSTRSPSGSDESRQRAHNAWMHATNGNGTWEAARAKSWNKLMHALNGNTEAVDMFELEQAEPKQAEVQAVSSAAVDEGSSSSASGNRIDAPRPPGERIFSDNRLDELWIDQHRGNLTAIETDANMATREAMSYFGTTVVDWACAANGTISNGTYAVPAVRGVIFQDGTSVLTSDMLADGLSLLDGGSPGAVSSTMRYNLPNIQGSTALAYAAMIGKKANQGYGGSTAVVLLRLRLKQLSLVRANPGAINYFDDTPVGDDGTLTTFSAAQFHLSRPNPDLNGGVPIQEGTAMNVVVIRRDEYIAMLNGDYATGDPILDDISLHGSDVAVIPMLTSWLGYAFANSAWFEIYMAHPWGTLLQSNGWWTVATGVFNEFSANPSPNIPSFCPVQGPMYGAVFVVCDVDAGQPMMRLADRTGALLDVAHGVVVDAGPTMFGNGTGWVGEGAVNGAERDIRIAALNACEARWNLGGSRSAQVTAETVCADICLGNRFRYPWTRNLDVVQSTTSDGPAASRFPILVNSPTWMNMTTASGIPWSPLPQTAVSGWVAAAPAPPIGPPADFTHTIGMPDPLFNIAVMSKYLLLQERAVPTYGSTIWNIAWEMWNLHTSIADMAEEYYKTIGVRPHELWSIDSEEVYQDRMRDVAVNSIMDTIYQELPGAVFDVRRGLCPDTNGYSLFFTPLGGSEVWCRFDALRSERYLESKLKVSNFTENGVMHVSKTFEWIQVKVGATMIRMLYFGTEDRTSGQNEKLRTARTFGLSGFDINANIIDTSPLRATNAGTQFAHWLGWCSGDPHELDKINTYIGAKVLAVAPLHTPAGVDIVMPCVVVQPQFYKQEAVFFAFYNWGQGVTRKDRWQLCSVLPKVIVTDELTQYENQYGPQELNAYSSFRF
jgi:hypothetical protein